MHHDLITRNPLCRTLGLALAVGAALSLGACAGSGGSLGGDGGGWWKETTPIVDQGAIDTTGGDGITIERLLSSGTPVADALTGMGPMVRAFNAHVTTLSNPYFEGRAPGSRGIELASEYIRFYFNMFGLEPVVPMDGGSELSFEHNFTVKGELVVHSASASYAAGHLDNALGDDEFSPLGFSGSEEVEGAPIVFVGYSMDEGKDGYTSYDEGADLTGKVAMILRFEPMDEAGKSLWASENEGRWTMNAGLMPKINAAIKRGAAGVILVNPPEADDPRAGRLLTADRSGYNLDLDGPAIMLSTEAAEALVLAGDAEGRSLLDLRKLADSGEAKTIELHSTFSASVDLEQQEITTHNVAGVLPGKGSLAGEYVVVGAHYDHLGYGRYGSRAADPAGKIHPGADDNASGTAGMLIAAQRLSKAYAAMPEDAEARSVLFLAFSAEEMGLIGSKEFVDAGILSPGEMYCMLNMDMIGRVRDKELQVGGLGTGEGLEEFVMPYLDGSGFDVTTNQSGWGPTDHTSFNAAGVVVLNFFTGLHREYHTPDDTASTVNRAGGAAVSTLISDIAYGLAVRDETMAHIDKGPRPSPGRTRAKVRLGIAPGNYASDEPGVEVGDVFEGTTAAIAGVLKGDRIIRWGGEELSDVMGMMEHLGDHKPGDKVRITVVRDGKEIDLDLVMKAREGGGLDAFMAGSHETGHAHHPDDGHDHGEDEPEIN